MSRGFSVRKKNRGGGNCHRKETGMLPVSLRGVKLQILVLHRVFGMESHYVCPFLSLMDVHKEICKKCCDVCVSIHGLPYGLVRLSLSHTQIGLP